MMNFNAICQFKTQLTELVNRFPQCLKIPQLHFRFFQCTAATSTHHSGWSGFALRFFSSGYTSPEPSGVQKWWRSLDGLLEPKKMWMKQICHLQYERENRSFLHGCSEGMWCVTWCRSKKWTQRPAGVSAVVYHEHLEYSFLLYVAFW